MSSQPPAAGRPPSPSGLRLGRVFGVPIYLRYGWLLLALAVVLLYGPVAGQALGLGPVARYGFALGFVVSLLLSVLLHELGHAVVARRSGVAVRAITLDLLGGYTEMESDAPRPGADLLIAVIGPVISALLGVGSLFVYFALPDHTVVKQLAFQLAWSNIIVAVFNALPGIPLDGGRALRALVWLSTGDRNRATVTAGWAGRVVALLTVLGGLWLLYHGWSLFSFLFLTIIAVTMWQGAGAAIAQGTIAARLPALDLRRLARPLLTVPTGTPLSETDRHAAAAAASTATAGYSGPIPIGVVDGSGQVIALVVGPAAEAVPAHRRPWVPVDSVARAVDPRQRLAADLAGEDLVRAVQAFPAPVYLIVDGTTILGVLLTNDLARALS